MKTLEKILRLFNPRGLLLATAITGFTLSTSNAKPLETQQGNLEQTANQASEDSTSNIYETGFGYMMVTGGKGTFGKNISGPNLGLEIAFSFGPKKPSILKSRFLAGIGYSHMWNKISQLSEEYKKREEEGRISYTDDNIYLTGGLKLTKDLYIISNLGFSWEIIQLITNEWCDRCGVQYGDFEILRSKRYPTRSYGLRYYFGGGAVGAGLVLGLEHNNRKGLVLGIGAGGRFD